MVNSVKIPISDKTTTSLEQISEISIKDTQILKISPYDNSVLTINLILLAIKIDS